MRVFPFFLVISHFHLSDSVWLRGLYAIVYVKSTIRTKTRSSFWWHNQMDPFYFSTHFLFTICFHYIQCTQTIKHWRLMALNSRWNKTKRNYENMPSDINTKERVSCILKRFFFLLIHYLWEICCACVCVCVIRSILINIRILFEKKNASKTNDSHPFSFELVDTKEGNVYNIVWIFKIVLDFFFLFCHSHTIRNEKYLGRMKIKKNTLFQLPSENENYRIINSFIFLFFGLFALINSLFIQHITLPMALLLSNAMFYIPFCQCTVYVCRHAQNYYEALFFFFLLDLLLFHSVV